MSDQKKGATFKGVPVEIRSDVPSGHMYFLNDDKVVGHIDARTRWQRIRDWLWLKYAGIRFRKARKRMRKAGFWSAGLDNKVQPLQPAINARIKGQLKDPKDGQ